MSAWQIVRNRQFWGIALPRFLAEPAWGTFNAWIPLFMFKAYGFNLKEIAMFAWMPMLFADPAASSAATCRRCSRNISRSI